MTLSLLFADDTELLLSGGKSTQQSMEVAERDLDRNAKENVTVNSLVINEARTQNQMCSQSREPVEGSDSAVKMLAFKIDPK